MNSTNIIGRIGSDISLKFLQSGSAIASFSIAVDQSYKKDGQKIEKTSWFDISAFAKTAENLNNFFHKGSMIGVSGELEQQTWTDQSGAKKSKVIIKLQSFTFIDKFDNQQVPQQQQYQAPTQQQYQAPAQQQQSYQPPQKHTDYRQPATQQQQQQPTYGNQQPRQPQQPQQQARQMPSSDSIPVIDIDEDEIPF